MSDISMCKGGSCLLRLNCYRYTAKAEPLVQSFFAEPPYQLTIASDKSGGGAILLTCEYFWNNKENDDEKPTNN